MSLSAIPLWKKKANDCLKRSYKVDLSGENIDNLQNFGTNKLMVQLDLSYVQSISSLEGLSLQPALQTLILDGSSISSLKNFSSISTVTSLSLKNTPLFLSTPRFNLIASILIILPKLKIYNGKLLSQKTIEKVKAANYPPETAEMVNLGWIVEYPCPAQSVFAKIYAEIVDPTTEINIETPVIEPDSQQLPVEKSVKPISGDNFDEIAQISKRSHSAFSPSYSPFKSQIEISPRRSPKSFKDIQNEQNENESNLTQKVADILRNHGIEIDVNNLQRSVLNAIDSLCSERERQVNSVMATYSRPKNDHLHKHIKDLNADFDDYNESD